MIWGDFPPRQRPGPPVEKWNSPLALVAAVLWLVIVLVLAPWALTREAETHPVHAGQQQTTTP